MKSIKYKALIFKNRIMINANQLFFLSAFAIAFTFSSCKKDDPDPEPVVGTTPGTSFDNGVFVTNEGPFGTGTGTISFYSRSSGSVSNDIFESKNGYPLGNIVQSMEIYNGKAYVIVNNSGKVEVADGTSFASAGAITGFTYPRYFLGINTTKGYVSEWGLGGVLGAIKIINLTTNTVTGTIPTGKGAEAMVLAGTKVYVTCSGGFDNDSIVNVINTLTNAVETTINVGANPKSIKMDANGKLWVLCSGQWDPTYTFLMKPGKLVRIDTATNTVDLSLPFASTTSQPSNLVINNSLTSLYYSYNGAVYAQGYTATGLSGSAIINRSFYGFGIDPVNDYFYGSDAVDFSSNGKVIRYNASATVVDSFAVGVIPGNFFFK
jgi:YVTN family beta-propeller protein